MNIDANFDNLFNMMPCIGFIVTEDCEIKRANIVSQTQFDMPPLYTTAEFLIDAIKSYRQKPSNNFYKVTYDDIVLKAKIIPHVFAGDDRDHYVVIMSYLEKAGEESHNLDYGVVGSSDIFKKTLNMVKGLAPLDTSVLLTGESGTGKHLLANLIRLYSNRKDGPYEVVNLAAVPESLLQTTLFGRVKGAFTDAKTTEVGIFENCHKGTLVLNCLADTSPAMQQSLLRVLETKQIQRVGSFDTIQCDIRFIFIASDRLKAKVQDGSFREDLYYRISSVEVEVPPLRERGRDCIDLLFMFLHKFSASEGKRIQHIDREIIELFERYRWPGNIRELKNVVEQALSSCDYNSIKLKDIKLNSSNRYNEIHLNIDELLERGVPLKHTLERVEKDILRAALDSSNGVAAQAARTLGLSKAGLHKKSHKYDL